MISCEEREDCVCKYIGWMSFYYFEFGGKYCVAGGMSGFTVVAGLERGLIVIFLSVMHMYGCNV